LTKKSELIEMVAPTHRGERRFGLRPRRVEHQHIHGPELALDRVDEPRHRLGVSDVRCESGRGTAPLADRRRHRLALAPTVVDRHCEAVAREPLSDRVAQATRAARHKRDPHRPPETGAAPTNARPIAVPELPRSMRRHRRFLGDCGVRMP
jgi:hypothetical protein